MFLKTEFFKLRLSLIEAFRTEILKLMLLEGDLKSFHTRDLNFTKLIKDFCHFFYSDKPIHLKIKLNANQSSEVKENNLN